MVQLRPWLYAFFALISFRAYSAATDNLWLCPDPSGVDNVVSATSAPAPACEPYSIHKIKPKQSDSAPEQTAKPRPQTPAKGKLTVSNTPPEGVLPSVPPPLDFSNVPYAPLTPVPIFQYALPTTRIYREDATKIYLCPASGNGTAKSQVIEAKTKPKASCIVMGAKGGAKALVRPSVASASNDHNLASEIKVNVLETDEQRPPIADNLAAKNLNTEGEKIYLCQDAQGDQSIIQSINPPAENCQVMGVTSEGGDEATKLTTEEHTTIDTGDDSAATQAAIATTSSQPGDIYKCYDDEGLPSFVNENARKNFQRCTFFSRSFAAVSKSIGQPQNLGNGNENSLSCSGAGRVEINGEVHAYECATRSYDHTPGSSGGEIRLGDRHATIAAYDQDYLNTSGSCGGTITSANGRVLHLEPTKNCPAAFQIVAQEIAQAVRTGLNVAVSGAFLERQRGLSAQINRIAKEIGVDPYLVHAVISAESAYKSRAVSHAGAQGLMQLMPPTAKRFNVSDPFHTGQNIRGGATYLKWLLKKFNGNMQLAIAGYNAGEGNVIKYGYKIPPFIETKAYVPKVMQYYRRYRSNPALIGL
ncbi:lytic transglycosylase domain-containing protein [Cardiobacteriaceae bacterium TAE3-ERU3]|nr:lytic transglycosylase domain-containing protein [Cardiobacteriaceae bacterium TAE3-ERU3]